MSYAANRTTAARLLQSKGQALTLTRRAAGTYDAATGTAAITASTQAAYGVLLPLTPYRKSLDSNIAAGDQQLLLSAISTAGGTITPPHVDDTVTDSNGAVWAIIAVEPLAPDGLDIMYDCTVRRAA